MLRAQRGSGKRWVSEQLSALAAAEGVDLAAIEWRVDLDGTYWAVVRTSHATLCEGFCERSLDAWRTLSLGCVKRSRRTHSHAPRPGTTLAL
jgi:hypothetical protein